MRNAYLLLLFTVLALWGTQAQNQEPNLLNQLATHQQQWFTYTAQNQAQIQAKVDRMKEGIEGQLQALRMKLEIQLQALRDIITSRQSKG